MFMVLVVGEWKSPRHDYRAGNLIKLPIIATVNAVYKLTWHNVTYAIRISWLWCVLIISLSQFIFPYLVIEDEGTKFGRLEWGLLALWLIVYAAGWSSIAVLWHRRLLRDEAPGGVPIRLDAFAWRYLLRFIFIFCLVGILASLVEALSGDRFAIVNSIRGSVSGLAELAFENPLWFLISLLISAAMIMMSLRLSVALPAAAVGDVTNGPAAAWDATAGNSFRLLMIAILVALPLLAVDSLVSRLEAPLTSSGEPLSELLHIVISQVLSLFPLLLGVTLLSLVYAILIEKRAISPTGVGSNEDL